MPLRFLAALSSLIVLSACGTTAGSPEARRADRTALVQHTLNAEALVEYFHFDLRPPPIAVVNASGADMDLGALRAGNVPVLPGASANVRALILDEVRAGPRRGRVAFRFPFEGIVGRADFARRGGGAGWELLAVEVHET